MKKTALLVLGSIALVGLAAVSGAPFEAGDSGICYDALLRCLDDPAHQITLTGQLQCFLGYSFCLKFIETG